MVGQVPEAGTDRQLWYRRYRGAAYAFALAALAWTAAMVLPFAPFSDVPPIIVGGGAGVWLLVGYVLFVTVGIGGFGALTSFLVAVELHEKRTVDSRVMWPATIILIVGFVGSCVLLGAAGAVGGYDSTFQSASAHAIDDLLSPLVDPITVLVLITVVGAALAIIAMIRARWPAP
jgi:hypothetical protein